MDSSAASSAAPSLPPGRSPEIITRPVKPVLKLEAPLTVALQLFFADGIECWQFFRICQLAVDDCSELAAVPRRANFGSASEERLPAGKTTVPRAVPALIHRW